MCLSQELIYLLRKARFICDQGRQRRLEAEKKRARLTRPLPLVTFTAAPLTPEPAAAKESITLVGVVRALVSDFEDDDVFKYIVGFI
jgi:hypothetical protein